MAQALSDEQVADNVKKMDGWKHQNDKLNREYKFKNFRDAMAFITRIAFEAEEQVHHPEIFNVYNKVNISLSTHDADGKVTEKDIKLAKTIEPLYNK
ncbi:MAG TPA: 4a-hydroxytetrahydrobiopterin dehydratase [Balneolaceae bacterium]|nr:4a-hydroxytetrahydrobiopterin dehydratase [Balneolaceae bacterium]